MADGQNSGFGRGGGQGGVPPIDPEALNAVLKAYGVQMPTQLQPPGPFEAMGFAGKHPRLATGMDNALIAMAGMGPTQMSAGDNVSNVARGVLGIQPYRRQQMAQQFEAPLGVAKEVGALQMQQGALKRDTAYYDYMMNRNQTGENEAMIRANAQRDAAATRAHASEFNSQMRTAPLLMDPETPGGPPRVGIRQMGEDGTVSLVPLPGADPRGLLKQQHVTAFGGGAQGEHIAVNLGRDFGGYDKIPANDPTAIVPAGKYKGQMLADAVNGYSKEYRTQAAQAIYMGDAGYRAAQPPSVVDNWKEHIATWKQSANDMLYSKMGHNKDGNGPGDLLYDSTVKRYMDQGMGWNAADAAASAELLDHDARINQAKSNFLQMSPTDQERVGGFTQYVTDQGYNPTTHSWSGPAQVPVSATGRPSSGLAGVPPPSGGGRGSAMGAPAKPGASAKPLTNIMVDDKGHKIGVDPDTNKWVDFDTRKPIQ